MDGKHILVAGGAGFIGSNIVEHLLAETLVNKVTVLDNLSTGKMENISHLEADNRLTVIICDLMDQKACERACHGVDAVLCQAALGSVVRSMKTPLESHNSNVHGFLNLLDAARKSGVKRFVYASSSAVYGNTKNVNDLDFCRPVSFYGLTKHVNDLYAAYYSKFFGMECIGLRYHNVFGKNQPFDGEYSAVIPIFVNNALRDNVLLVHGDGSQYRDFTHVSNVVHANMLCLATTNPNVFGKSFDIGSGCKVSVLDLAKFILSIHKSRSTIEFTERRVGDIHASYANMELSRVFLLYDPVTNFEEGIKKTIEEFAQKL